MEDRIYLVSLHSSTDGDLSYEPRAFSTKEKAIEYFNKRVELEATQSWAAEELKDSKHLADDSKGYTLEYDENEHWLIYLTDYFDDMHIEIELIELPIDKED